MCHVCSFTHGLFIYFNGVLCQKCMQLNVLHIKSLPVIFYSIYVIEEGYWEKLISAHDPVKMCTDLNIHCSH